MDGIRTWYAYVEKNQDDVIERTIQHAQMTITVIILATIFSVALGFFVQQRPLLRTASLTVAGILLTIPSLALFALFIPIVGIGDRPAMIALFLYAILPILRNTVTGLDEVNPAVVESARGMGMGKTRQLIQVKLPLAWPVIMAGIRISTLMVVGIAAIAVLVGGGGLGTFIQGGLTRLGLPNAIESVWTGVIFIVLLGLILDILLALLQRLSTPRGLRI